jgi:L-fuculose-phosphate aldolase
MKTELDLRKAIIDIGRRMWERNYVAATDGNISIRLSPDRYLCTPSGVSKGFMAVNDLIVCDGKGNKISGDGKVTSEIYTHLAAYEERADVHAVVHAHPPKAIGFSVAGVSMAECILPEVVYSIGGVPTTEYATPATREGSEVIREYIGRCDAVLMDRHGSITVGADVVEAYLKLEKIEHACESLLVAHHLGHVRHLDREEIEKLQDVRKSYGVTGLAYPCEGDACSCDAPPSDAPPSDAPVRNAPVSEAHEGAMNNIIDETLQILGGGARR